MASATTATPVTPKGFDFSKNLSLLNGQASLGFDFTSQIAPDVALALATPGQPFPRRDFALADTKLTAKTANPIEFSRGADKISFTASGGAFAGLGVYQTGAAAIKDLGDGAQDFNLSGVEFGADKDSILTVLRWGFNANGKISGAMALGAVGQATLTVAGDAEGLFGVIRRLPASTPARVVVQSATDNWLLPRLITSASQLDPGTWIVSEVAGGISVNLGAQLGYDFNWVREAKLGGLSGDIGLRLQMGINAAIGFSASGRCAVVVNRDSDAKTLRLRLFRLKSREMDLSLDASLSVQGKDKLLPDKIDDFISAVFDVHGQQILHDLQALEGWTDPGKPLSDVLANAGIDGAEKLIANLAGVTPEQLQQSFDKIHDTAVSFIKKWHDLPNRVSSTIMKLVEETVDLTDVRDLVNDLSTITPDGLKDLLNTQLNRSDFFLTPQGRLLEAIADDGVLVLPAKPIADIHDLATKVKSVLDGSLIEDQLKKFQSFVETQLHLDKVIPVVNDTDFAGLDALLKKKLAKFLNQDNIVLKDLDKVRTVLHLLITKRDEYYKKALDAVRRQYNFDCTGTYQSVTTDQALLDATFDFSTDPAGVSDLFQQAVQGKLDDLLTQQHPGITLGAAKISHGIKRQATVDVTLPYLHFSETHLNESLASVSATSQDGSLLFTLSSTDMVASNRRKSVLSLTMNLTGTGVRIHSDSIQTNYTMLYAKQNMKLGDVKAQIGPAIDQYFKTKIPSVPDFLTFLDTRAEESVPNGPNLLGNGLISLQVSLSADAAKTAGNAWLSLPTSKQSGVYGDMSRAIQRSVKAAVHDSYFRDQDAYFNTDTARTILAYCALVPAAPVPSGLNGQPLWDTADSNARRQMLSHPQTLAKMKDLLGTAQKALDGLSKAQFFEPDDAEQILKNIVTNGQGLQGSVFQNLLLAESEIVRKAFEGGLAIAKGIASARPSDAVAAIADFGSSLTDAFNASITSLLGPGLRALGTRVFLDASAAIVQQQGQLQTSALLSIEFLKPEVKFDSAALLAAGHIEAAQLAFSDRAVQI